MANHDGGFLWLVGTILGGVDSSFSYTDSVIGQQGYDGDRHIYVEQKHNDKGETHRHGFVETRYRDWNDSVGWGNRHDLRTLNDMDQDRAPWWWH